MTGARIQVPWVLNHHGRPMHAWRLWPPCCSKLYAATLLSSLTAFRLHQPGPPAICSVHGNVRQRPDAP